MSEKISPEIEELLWTTAESGDESLEQEFIRRYPQLRAQLATRKAMLEVLRSARPAASAPRVFRAPVTRPARYWLVPVAAALMFTLALAGYRITQAWSRPEGQPKPMPSANAAGNVVSPPRTGADPAPGATRQGDPGTAERPAPAQVAAIVQVQAGKTTLFALIEALIAQGKVTIVRMPDVPDKTFEVKANRPDGTARLSPPEWLRLIEQVADVRVIDAGTDGYYLVPIDKVKNVEDGLGPDKLAPSDGF